MNNDKVAICIECGSQFLKSSSRMMELCPECVHIAIGMVVKANI